MPDSARTNASKPRSRKSIFVLLACLLFAALVFVSFLPTSKKSALHTMGRFHAVGHVLAFTVVAYVAARAFRSRQARTAFFFVALLAGFAIEMGEHLIYGSALEWNDIFDDSIGVLIGALLALLSTSKPSEHL